MKFAVIFDMDGVLVDTFQAHQLAWTKLAKNLNVEMNPEYFKNTFGLHNREIFSGWLKNTFTKEQMMEFAKEKEALYREFAPDNVTPIPGVIKIIEYLSKNKIPMGIGSAGPRENVALAVKILGAEKNFQAIVTGSDVIHGKPHPEVYLKVASLLDFEPSHCVVIEDSIPGVSAAKRAKAKCVGITTTRPRQVLIEAGADLVIDSYDDLSMEKLEKLVEAGNK